MSASLILAVDQGTTNAKAMLVGRSGEPVFRVSQPLSLIHTERDYVEQCPQLIWETMRNVMVQCAIHAAASGAAIEGIAISNQRETALIWDRETSQPMANAVSWQCRRSAALCNRLAPHSSLIRRKSGLPLAPLLSAGKWACLLESRSELRELAASGKLCFGTVDSWLVYKLTGGHVHATDLSNASRTGLLNLDTLCWDDELLGIFGLPRAAMPQLRPSSGCFGNCTAIPELAGIPIVSAIGDSHAALVGHGSYSVGTIKATYGTGSSLMALTPGLVSETPDLARTIAWSIGEQTQFALEGNINMTGSAVQWTGEFLGLENPTKDVVALAAGVPDAGGVYFVPAMVGLGAPHWDFAARGVISGLGKSHTAKHLARAAIDAIAYQVADVFFAMEKVAGIPLPQLHTDGGATCNMELMQFQADLLGRPVLRSSNEELSALGAAWLGGLALGWWPSLADLAALAHPAETFEPKLASAERECLYRGWQQAVRRARLS
jgi:glycerol kinase